jgi:hypothetical protein
MATPCVTVRPIKRKKESQYQVDSAVGGKRFRKTFGHNKMNADPIRAKIQSDLVSGKCGTPSPSSTVEK